MKARKRPRASKVLVIDDDPGVLEALGLILSQEGFDVALAGSGDEGVTTARGAAPADAFDAVITDLKMAGMSGLEALAALRQHDPLLPVIVVSGFLSDEAAATCARLGALATLRKPFDVGDLLAIQQRGLEARGAALTLIGKP